MSGIVTYKGRGWCLLENTNKHILRPNLIVRETSAACFPSAASAIIREGTMSHLEGACNRQTYYRMLGEPVTNPPDAYMTYIVEHGKYIEEFLVKRWKEMGIWVNNNIKFFTDKHGFPLSGEIDAFIMEPGLEKTKDVTIAEIKSYYGYFKKTKLMGNKTTPGRPENTNLFQLMLYLDFYSKAGITKGKLIYTARDEGKQFEFDVSLVKQNGQTYANVDGEVYTHFSLEDVISRYQELWAYWQKKELPPRDYKLVYDEKDMEEGFKAGQITKTRYNDFMSGKSTSQGAWQCLLCSHRDLCWERKITLERFEID